MPATTLSNYGDGEFRTRGSLCSMDSGLLFSIGSHVDVYSPPRKRSRISGPFVLLFEEEKKPTIEVLPDECLFEIFRHLQGGQARSASACVSKRWLTVLSNVRCSEFISSKSQNDTEMMSTDKNEGENDGFLTRCLEGKKATDNRLAAISVGTAVRGGLGKLSIRGSSNVTSLGFSAIAHGCPSLRALSLWNVPSVGDEALIEISNECHLLEKLELSHCPSITSKGVIAIAEKCPNLTSLTIESCSSIGNESLQAIGRCCPFLQCISIRDCPLIGDQGVASLFASGSSTLKKIMLQTLSITDFSLAVIGHYGKSITSLVLSGLRSVSQKGYWAMGNEQGLHSLSSLTITSCQRLTDMSLEGIGKGCQSLKQMSLKKCCFVSDSGLIAFSRASASVENLHLEECNRISLEGILEAISNCKSKLKSLSLVKCLGIKDLAMETTIYAPCESLRSLTIRDCIGFGSSSLAILGKLSPKLQHVDLSGICGINDAGLLTLLQSVEGGLTKVNLSDCFNLTDDVVVALARLHGGTLKTLNLGGCRKISDKSLAAIADNCPLLNDLDLSKCDITNCGLFSLSRGKQVNLQVLSLSGCSKISSKSISCLMKLGKTLLGLNLQRCKSISGGTMELLMENLWKCDILS